MDQKERICMLEKTLDRLLSLVKGADAKISPVLALDSAMLGVFAALVLPVKDWSLPILFLILFTVGSLLLSLLFLAMTSFPRTKGPKETNIYFEGILKTGQEAYPDKINNLNEESYISDLTSQCYRNAEISSKKYKYIKTSMIYLFISILPWLFLIYSFFNRKSA